jgi:sulfoxide reductase heme-binding subunit YedZ
MREHINRWLIGRWAKPVFFSLAMLPFAWLVLAAVMDWLGANPAEALERSSFAAFVLLTPLALTSFNRAIRALGGRRWQLLHRLVYAVAVLAVVHFFWMRAGKNNFAEVAVYAVILGNLLSWRLLRFLRKRADSPR